MTTLARNDRHVLHGRMRISPGAPRHALFFNVEEALRLCSLPGENEGRAYYLRRLDVRGLPENGDRQSWLEAFQRELLDLARYAVYGKESTARDADAIYFHTEQDACESLLSSILRRRNVDAWFWPAVSGSAPGASASAQIVSAIGKLSRTEASWMAVAAAVFTAGDSLLLVNILPLNAVQQWLQELGTSHAAPLSGTPVRLPDTTLPAVLQAAALLGREDPRVAWLAALAVILAHPSEIEAGTAVHSGRLGLRAIADISLPRELNLNRARPSDLRPLNQTSPERESPSPGPDHTASHPTSIDPAVAGEPDAYLDLTHDGTPDAMAPRVRQADPSSATAQLRGPRAISMQPEARPGERTEGAGLYFLLNALRDLGVVDARIGQPFLAHLFQRVARFTGIEYGDPILLWTVSTLEEHPAGKIDNRELRIWLWKLRRWCWRNGGISLREVVRRPGIVTLTRTDLDVSLPLDSAEIRIRRIGLDLNPGWVPWFGRVVRFHYVGRGEVR